MAGHLFFKETFDGSVDKVSVSGKKKCIVTDLEVMGPYPCWIQFVVLLVQTRGLLHVRLKHA